MRSVKKKSHRSEDLVRWCPIHRCSSCHRRIRKCIENCSCSNSLSDYLWFVFSLRVMVHSIVCTKYFEMMVMGVICLSSISLAAEDPVDEENPRWFFWKAEIRCKFITEVEGKMKDQETRSVTGTKCCNTWITASQEYSRVRCYWRWIGTFHRLPYFLGAWRSIIDLQGV